MRRISRTSPLIERLLPDSPAIRIERNRLCRVCALRAINRPSSRSFSTSRPRREEEPKKADVPKTWAGLDWVGTPEWMDAYMAPKQPFEPFAPVEKIPEEQLEREVLSALVEATITSGDLENNMGDNTANQGWPPGVEVRVKREGARRTPEVVFSKEADRKELADAILGISENEAEGMFPSSPNNEWKRISLEDPGFKFHFIKRVMQRTGVRLPDPVIQDCRTIGALYNKMLQKPKAKKLAQAIETDKNLVDLVSMPNVEFQGRRFTPIDKDKEIGRWKVIEEELEARGLPVTGHPG